MLAFFAENPGLVRRRGGKKGRWRRWWWWWRGGKGGRNKERKWNVEMAECYKGPWKLSLVMISKSLSHHFMFCSSVFAVEALIRIPPTPFFFQHGKKWNPWWKTNTYFIPGFRQTAHCMIRLFSRWALHPATQKEGTTNRLEDCKQSVPWKNG